MIVFRVAVAIFAVILIIVGIITTPTPVPFGVVFIAIGLMLLATAAPAVVRALRHRWAWFNKAMRKATEILPRFIARPLRRTDPDLECEEDEVSPNRDETREARAFRPRARG